MSQNSIARAENLFDFFHASVDAAANRVGSPVSEEGLYYLSHLLVERGRAPEKGTPDTLVELYAAAQQGGAARVSALRELADRALYMTGFFRGSLRRRLVSVTYYMDMGASAYHRLSQISGGGGGEARGLDGVWGELSERFEAASDLLRDVREEVSVSAEHNDADLLRLYEAWLETGSPGLYQRLRELGVVPMRPKDEPRG